MMNLFRMIDETLTDNAKALYISIIGVMTYTLIMFALTVNYVYLAFVVASVIALIVTTIQLVKELNFIIKVYENYIREEEL